MKPHIALHHSNFYRAVRKDDRMSARYWNALTPTPSQRERGLRMLAKLKTFSLVGIDALPVEVEVDVSPAGLPKTVLVGLPEAAVKESTYRVERAMVNSGFQRPLSRVVINLAPACSHE
jgi:hypothetical protein